MKRKPLVLANWKMAMTMDQSRQFLRTFYPMVKDVDGIVDVVLCPPFTSMHFLSCLCKETFVQIGAQNIHPGPEETFTGEVSAQLASDAGAQYVLLGHSERRRYLGENDSTVNQKALAAITMQQLTPVFLIGEVAEVGIGNTDYLHQQMTALYDGISASDSSSCLIMYEPEEAVGLDTAVSPRKIEDGCRFIRQWIANNYNDNVAQMIRIIYGGSVTETNSDDIIRLPNVDGLAVGRKSRDAVAFASIVRQVAAYSAMLDRRT